MSGKVNTCRAEHELRRYAMPPMVADNTCARSRTERPLCFVYEIVAYHDNPVDLMLQCLECCNLYPDAQAEEAFRNSQHG